MQRQNQPTARDLELLSAYLDDALTPRAREQLETRLKNDTQLQRSLAEMRATRTLLRRLPVLKAMRNYTLSPEQAARIRPLRRAWPNVWLQLATAAVAILFAVVLVGGPLTFQAAGDLAMAPEPVMEMEGELLDGGGGAQNDTGGVAETMPAEATMAFAATGEEELLEAPMEEPVEAPAADAPTDEIQPGAGVEDDDLSEGIAGADDGASPPPMPTATASDSLRLDDGLGGDGTGEATLLPMATEALLTAPPTALPGPSATAPSEVGSTVTTLTGPSPWTLLQWGLGLALVALLAANVWLWWQKRQR